MTQEEKELLFKDLCARLPYGLLVQISDYKTPQRVEAISDDLEVRVNNIFVYSLLYESKPYLRPMSSMTEEEKEELKEIGSEYLEKWENAQDSIDKWKLDAEVSCKRSKFYNSHLLDWNGLIPKGLAIEASKDMYNIKEE